MNQLREGCKPKAKLSRELLVGLEVGGKQQQGGNQESTGDALLRAGGVAVAGGGQNVLLPKLMQF